MTDNTLSQLHIRYVANCGLFVRTPEGTLLIDGLIRSSAKYDTLPDAEKERIFGHETPYEKIDYLVYTHLHSDHFSAPLTREYLAENPLTKAILPDNGRKFLTELYPDPEVEAAQVTYIEPDTERSTILATGALTLRVIRCSHVVFDYPQTYCLLVQYGEESIFIADDMDPVFLKELAGTGFDRADVAFINPFFISTDDYVRKVKEMSYSRIYIYHIPSPAVRDKHGIRAMALEGMERRGSELPNMELLMGPLCELC